MEIKWCWRCRIKVPMLDEVEYQIARELYSKGFRNLTVENDRKLRFKEMLDYYAEITGYIETEPNAILHHRIENFGSDCPNCEKPLRTKKANFCVECGFEKAKKMYKE